ncbi:MAG: FIG00899427: hypothetical protein [uncultured Caballeronia sp.]|nr:MAG: FIG00899427: hypothetical protein [uncultured Caballeronia sp.]
MSGLTKQTPIPTGIVVHSKTRALELQYPNDQTCRIPFELLRVYSPSAEVQGHGPGQEMLQTGKRDVLIIAIEPVGHYALQLNFSDGRNTGLYSWDILHDFAVRQDELWADYLAKLEAAATVTDRFLSATAICRGNRLQVRFRTRPTTRTR